MHILLGVTGSVAAKHTTKLISALKEKNEVQVVATEPSFYFWKSEDTDVPVWRDKDEWPNNSYTERQKIGHIELRDWADIIVIAPLTANTLAKLAHGMSDNLLTSVMRAWKIEKPVVLAPAMNTQMWQNPATAEHIATLKRWYPRLTIVEPVLKTLACGERGIGAMALIETIVQVAK